MKYTVTVALTNSEINTALKLAALERVDIGRPFDKDTATIDIISGPLGTYTASVVLEVS